MPSIFSQYRGRDRGVPAGFMQAASMPGQLIGAGIQQLAAGVSDAVTAVDERHKQEAKLGKAAETFFESIPEKDRPMDLQAFKNLAATDKVAKMKGLVEAQAYRKGAEDIITQLANRRAVEANTKAVEGSNMTRTFLRNQEVEKAARRDLFNESVRQRMTMPEGELGPAKPLSPREIFEMSVRHGVNDNPIESLAEVTRAEKLSADMTPRELVFDGNPYIYAPNGQLIPNRKQGEAKLETLHDENGNPVAHYMIDPKTGQAKIVSREDKPKAADIIKFEEGFRALDKDIADQQALVDQKNKYANPDYLGQLKLRRSRLQEHYDQVYGSQPGAKESAQPAAAVPAAASPSAPGIRATWKNGKLVFPK